MNADKQYDRQFLAWAVDRALRFYEVNKQTCTPEEVTALAEKFCGWVMPAPDAEEAVPEKTAEELEKELNEKRVTLRGMKFNIAGSKIKNVREQRGAKKDIARLLTELNQRQ